MRSGINTCRMRRDDERTYATRDESDSVGSTSPTGATESKESKQRSAFETRVAISRDTCEAPGDLLDGSGWLIGVVESAVLAAVGCCAAIVAFLSSSFHPSNRFVHMSLRLFDHFSTYALIPM